MVAIWLATIARGTAVVEDRAALGRVVQRTAAEAAVAGADRLGLVVGEAWRMDRA
jgi:hypothetical protein